MAAIHRHGSGVQLLLPLPLLLLLLLAGGEARGDNVVAMLFSSNMAAGNVRGAMRPQGRSPSFFIVGLFLAVGILGFNYWSLSKRNHDLATQLLNMQDQLRVSISKRMNAERRGSNIVNELKKCETALDMDKNEVARKESEVITLTEQLKIKDIQINSHEAKVKEMEDLRTSLVSNEIAFVFVVQKC